MWQDLPAESKLFPVFCPENTAIQIALCSNVSTIMTMKQKNSALSIKKKHIIAFFLLMQPVPMLLLTELHTLSLSSCCSTHPFGWELAFAPLFLSGQVGMRGDRADQGLFSEGLRSQTASVLTATAPSGAGRACTTAADRGPGVGGKQKRRGHEEAGLQLLCLCSKLPGRLHPQPFLHRLLLCHKNFSSSSCQTCSYLLDETNSSTPFFCQFLQVSTPETKLERFIWRKLLPKGKVQGIGKAKHSASCHH